MASAFNYDVPPFDMDCPVNKVNRELSEVTAVFTLSVSNSLKVARMKTLKETLEEEVKTLDKALNRHGEDKEEMLQALDLLTWLEYKIGSPQKALELNDRALSLYENKATFSLGNRAHLIWYTQGDLEKMREYLDTIALRDEEVSKENQLAVTKAHQAYCYFRFGGAENVSKAIALYEEALKVNPGSHLWRQQAGMVYRRSTLDNSMSRYGPFDYKYKLKTERVKTAMDYFQCVAEQSPNPRLKGFAYSDVAFLATIVNKWYDKDLVLASCKNALRLWGNDPYVLMNCARSLKWIDRPKGRELLLKARKVHPTSHNLYQLGIFFSDMGDLKSVEGDADLAEKYFREALLLRPLNHVARLSLASLLRGLGKLTEAMRELRMIISTINSSDEKDFRLTLMKAYVEAALCQLDPNYVATLPHSKEDAEIMLTKALEIGFNLLGPQDRKKHLGKSFTSLKTLLVGKETPEALRMISEVYHLANEPERSLAAVKRLLDNSSGDPATVAFGLKAYLEQEHYEKAYALLQMYAAIPGSPAIAEALYKKVILSAVGYSLQQHSADVFRIFKAQFDRHRQQHRREDAANCAGHGLACVDQQAEAAGPADADLLDVLIFYDESDDGKSNLSDICGDLQETMSIVFGLNVSQNIQACCPGGLRADLQLKEMTRTELVLVVIGAEEMSKYFQALLRFLPSLMEKRDDNPNPPRVLVAPTHEGVSVPSSVSNFPRTATIEPTVANLRAFVQMCRGERVEPAESSAEDIKSFFCRLIDNVTKETGTA